MKSEALLEPLYTKLNHFTTKSTDQSCKATPRSATSIANSLDKFIKSLEDRCFRIITEVPKLSVDFQTVLSDVLNTNSLFRTALVAFTSNPMDFATHDELSRTGSALLSSLSRILILAEVADSNEYIELVAEAEESLARVMSSPSSKELSVAWTTFEKQVARLLDHLNRNSAEYSSRGLREQVEKANYVLSNNSRLLLTSCKAFLHHPEFSATQTTKQFAVETLSDALRSIHTILTETEQRDRIRLPVCGTLLSELESFENITLTDFSDFDEETGRHKVDDQLKRLLPLVYRTVDSGQTQPDQRESICTRCDRLEQSANRFLSEFSKQPVNRPALIAASKTLLDETGQLKHMLVGIVVSHLVEALMFREQPIMSLSDATKFGNTDRMDSALSAFQEHTGRMVTAAYELCSVSSNQEAAELVHLACGQLEQLCPQVTSAAYLLFTHPQSRTVASNFEAFQSSYETAANLLYTSLCGLINVHELLCVMDKAMREEFEIAHKALIESKENVLHDASTWMQYGSNLMCDILGRKLNAEGDNPPFVARLLEKSSLIHHEFVPAFTEIARDTFSHLAAHQEVDEDRFLNACRNLCVAVHDLLNIEQFGQLATPEPPTVTSDERNRQIVQAGVEEEDEVNRMNAASPVPDLNDESSVTEEDSVCERPPVFSRLTTLERQNISKEVASFVLEEKRLMCEVVQWDESENEIASLSKQMSMIMVNLADFVYEQGPLHTLEDVIQAAKQISEMGQRLCDMCRQIAELCPISSNRHNLLLNLDRVAFYSHQLTITSRVRASFDASRSSVAEDATALIQTARNLMKAVVDTVKESYVASTMYSSGQPIVRWQVRRPEKKPVTETQHEQLSDKRKRIHKRNITCVRELAEFNSSVVVDYQ